MTPDQQRQLLADLLTRVRIATLATLDADGAPYGSMSPFVHDPESGGLYVHLSQLAQHTKNLVADPRISMLVTEHDGPEHNPLALERVTLTGTVHSPEPEGADHQRIRALYLERFPQSAMIFQLPDFRFFGLVPQGIHLVAGFGKAWTMAPAVLKAPT